MLAKTTRLPLFSIVLRIVVAVVWCCLCVWAHPTNPVPPRTARKATHYTWFPLLFPDNPSHARAQPLPYAHNAGRLTWRAPLVHTAAAAFDMSKCYFPWVFSHFDLQNQQAQLPQRGWR